MEARHILAMTGKLGEAGNPDQLHAPLRIFTYAVAGGKTVEEKKRPIFKLMRTAGTSTPLQRRVQQWNEVTPDTQQANPYRHCIVVCDEAHNMYQKRASDNKALFQKRLTLRSWLNQSIDTVFVALTATPLRGETAEALMKQRNMLFSLLRGPATSPEQLALRQALRRQAYTLETGAEAPLNVGQAKLQAPEGYVFQFVQLHPDIYPRVSPPVEELARVLPVPLESFNLLKYLSMHNESMEKIAEQVAEDGVLTETMIAAASKKSVYCNTFFQSSLGAFGAGEAWNSMYQALSMRHGHISKRTANKLWQVVRDISSRPQEKTLIVADQSLLPAVELALFALFREANVEWASFRSEKEVRLSSDPVIAHKFSGFFAKPRRQFMRDVSPLLTQGVRSKFRGFLKRLVTDFDRRLQQIKDYVTLATGTKTMYVASRELLDKQLARAADEHADAVAEAEATSKARHLAILDGSKFDMADPLAQRSAQREFKVRYPRLHRLVQSDRLLEQVMLDMRSLQNQFLTKNKSAYQDKSNAATAHTAFAAKVSRVFAAAMAIYTDRWNHVVPPMVQNPAADELRVETLRRAERKKRDWGKTYMHLVADEEKGGYVAKAATALKEEYAHYLHTVKRHIRHQQDQADHLVQVLNESLKPDLFTAPETVKQRALCMIEQAVRFDSSDSEDLALVAEVDSLIKARIDGIRAKKEAQLKKMQEDRKRHEEDIARLEQQAVTGRMRLAKLVALKQLDQADEEDDDDSDDDGDEESRDRDVVLLPLADQMQTFVTKIKNIVAGLLCRFIEGQAVIDKSSPVKRYMQLKARFNKFDTRPYGSDGKPQIRVLAINSRQFGEGVSLLGVDRLKLLNPSRSYTEYRQLVGRVLRACASHPQTLYKDPVVRLDQYVAELNQEFTEKLMKARGKDDYVVPQMTADQVFLKNLHNQKRVVDSFLQDHVDLHAIDRGLYGKQKQRPPVPAEAAEAHLPHRYEQTKETKHTPVVPADKDLRLSDDKPWLAHNAPLATQGTQDAESDKQENIASAGARCIAVLQPFVANKQSKEETAARRMALRQRKALFLKKQPGTDEEKKKAWTRLVNQEAADRRREQATAKARGQSLEKEIAAARAYAAEHYANMNALVNTLASIRNQLVDRQEKLHRAVESDDAGVVKVKAIRTDIRQGARRSGR